MKRITFPPFWDAVGLIGGMIIGVGIFTLPFATALSGWWGSLGGALVAFYAVLSIHLAYGEVAATTTGSHRLPGHAALYLGKAVGSFEKVSQVFSFNFILVVYGIFGGQFLATIFGGSTFQWSVVFFLGAGAILLSPSARNIGFINLLLTLPLVGMILLLAFLSVRNGYAGTISLPSNDPFFSFGVWLFSLAGLSVIADARTVFKEKHMQPMLRSAIIVGTSIPFLLYVLFTSAVLAGVGSGVAENALLSLGEILGPWMLRLGGIIGFLAVITSYLALGYDLKEIYEFDSSMTRSISWMLTVTLPVLIFLFVADGTIQLISLIGGLFIALDGIFVILILRRVRSYNLGGSRFLSFGAVQQTFLIVVFLLSIVYEIVYQLLPLTRWLVG